MNKKEYRKQFKEFRKFAEALDEYEERFDKMKKILIEIDHIAEKYVNSKRASQPIDDYKTMMYIWHLINKELAYIIYEDIDKE